MITYRQKVDSILDWIEKTDESIVHWTESDGENSLMVRQYKHLHKDFIGQEV